MCVMCISIYKSRKHRQTELELLFHEHPCEPSMIHDEERGKRQMAKEMITKDTIKNNEKSSGVEEEAGEVCNFQI